MSATGTDPATGPFPPRNGVITAGWKRTDAAYQEREDGPSGRIADVAGGGRSNRRERLEEPGPGQAEVQVVLVEADLAYHPCTFSPRWPTWFDMSP
jgi:hypothetical protein